MPLKGKSFDLRLRFLTFWDNISDHLSCHACVHTLGFQKQSRGKRQERRHHTPAPCVFIKLLIAGEEDNTQERRVLLQDYTPNVSHK